MSVLKLPLFGRPPKERGELVIFFLCYNHFFRKFLKLVYIRNVAMVTLTTGIMFLLFTCTHFWVRGMLRRWSACGRPPMKWTVFAESLRNTGLYNNPAYSNGKMLWMLYCEERFKVLTVMETTSQHRRHQSTMNWDCKVSDRRLRKTLFHHLCRWARKTTNKILISHLWTNNRTLDTPNTKLDCSLLNRYFRFHNESFLQRLQYRNWVWILSSIGNSL
jgi:hypothetical protein